MARRTGIFAQMQREIARQQREQQRAEAAHIRQQAQAHLAAERAEREALRTQAAALRLGEQRARASARQQAEAEKQRRQAHVELQQARVAERNADIEASVSELDQLLSATLEVDDYIDFETLKRTADHPRFDARGLDKPTPTPTYRRYPSEPIFAQFTPPEPTGLSKLFGGKKRHAQEMGAAQQRFGEVHADWRRQIASVQQWNAGLDRKRDLAEKTRGEALAAARADFEQQCATRDREIAKHNADVQALADAFLAKDPQAIVQYFTLVLANSDYPKGFPQQYRLAYVPESSQLVIEYELPTMDCVPRVRAVRYVKSKDEITTTPRPARETRAIYASVVAQMTLRTLHEVFEADRSKILETVVFNGIVTTTDPGTGHEIKPCLVTVRTTRDVFLQLDISRVESLACLERLNASVSKKPGELAPVRPVLEFDMVDKRFVEETDVLTGLDQRPNLLELSPSEFEALIQNLFSAMGLDTKQTRPSRDGGVDCVAFDPRPIFGGKVVIQAKRYRNTVEVSAVRDLFGTLQNEGASKGILVTTSGYGAASFEFASGKPIELIDGSNLLYLLAEHTGLEAKIIEPDQEATFSTV